LLIEVATFAPELTTFEIEVATFEAELATYDFVPLPFQVQAKLSKHFNPQEYCYTACNSIVSS